MALSSPGVQVTVIDESFYTPAEPGTVPMIFVASAENKSNASGTGIAQGTLKANAGKPYLMTSQRDLAETFGDPTFYTDNNNNPIHGGELNEYGLQAAYSLLGVSNRAWVVRADIDLSALQASATAPAGNPVDNYAWFNTATSAYGVFQWNGASRANGGQIFEAVTPRVITTDTASTDLLNYNSVARTHDGPKSTVGFNNSYALVSVNTLNTLYYKTTKGVWVEVGTDAWKESHATIIADLDGSSQVTITINGNTTYPAAGTTAAELAADINDPAKSNAGVTATASGSTIYIYSANDIVITDSNATNIPNRTYSAPRVQISAHTSVPLFKSGDASPAPSGSVWVKSTVPNGGANWKVSRWNEATGLWEPTTAPLYANHSAALAALDAAGGGLNLASGALYVRYDEANDNRANFKLFERRAIGATSVISTGTWQAPVGTLTFTVAQSSAGGTMGVATSVTTSSAPTLADIVDAINSAGLPNVNASLSGSNVVITHDQGGEVEIVGGTEINNLFANVSSGGVVTISNWRTLTTYAANDTAPTSLTADNALWYNSIVDEVDIMVHDGSKWDGYLNVYPATNATGPIVSASEPTLQSDGTSALVDNDLWIDTSDLENYPTIRRYDTVAKKWILVDSGDQTTENGVLFTDARWGTDGTKEEASEIIDLLSSDYLDPDAPDSALYPKGMLLWNLRRSGFNVKKFVRNYLNIADKNIRFNDEDMSAYYPHRWVTESANNADGSGAFGRNAQRKVVVQALQAMVNSNDEIRDDESRVFNLMATPGYPELIGEMISLNYDRGLSAFVVGDSPLRLPPDATSLNEWSQNINLAVEDNDLGLVSRDEYLGIYYPSGFTSDNAGNNIVVPASHMMLRTIALSDQVAYPWFAPAGTRRGGITNASATGYVSAEGEFVSVALNEGQRDTLQAVSVNPITFLNGAGLVAYGQKTRARNASSLDRINVARLVIYLRSQLNKLAKPYIFEPNDKITRDQIKQAAESLMIELVGQRALYDFLVVCDESNNTPSRIDRNELYLDIAIEPVKAVEFIYIPLRLKNTGEIAGL